jgi:magnesium chelatase family protein
MTATATSPLGEWTEPTGVDQPRSGGCPPLTVDYKADERALERVFRFAEVTSSDPPESGGASRFSHGSAVHSGRRTAPPTHRRGHHFKEREMYAQAITYLLDGLQPRKVKVDLYITGGTPQFTIDPGAGISEVAIGRIRDVVRGAVLAGGFDFPDRRRISVRATRPPADVEEGEGLEFPIAAAILGASGQLDPESLRHLALAGCLRSDGTLGPLRGALQIAEAVAEDPGLDSLALASASAPQAACAGGVEVLRLHSLAALRYLAERDRERLRTDPLPLPLGADPEGPDFSEIRGLGPARRAAEVAAAGDHSLLLAGPRRADHALIARRIPSILPALSRSEALEALRIAGAHEEGGASPSSARPFRFAVPAASSLALLGGGTPPEAGGVTLAHNGVLFLEGVPTFDAGTLAAIGEARRRGYVLVGSPPRSLPSDFLLVASAHPCPLGRGCTPDPGCGCDAADATRHRRRLRAAAGDFEVIASYGPPSTEAPTGGAGEPSSAIRARVTEARARQAERLGEGRANRRMTAGEVEGCGLSATAVDYLNVAYPYPDLAGRRLQIARVARTIADLDGAEEIDSLHLAEAIDLSRTPRGGAEDQ